MEIFSNFYLDYALPYPFCLLSAFIEMDTDESGTVDSNECLVYFGGNRSKFTERIFYHPNEDQEHNDMKGHEFKPWSIVIWNFCTLTHSQMARLVFEIFDVHHKEILERPDIETMYKMLYNCDDFDEYYLGQIKFDDRLHITKGDFIQHCVHHRHIIQPIIDYQRKIRKKTGGVSMWESLLGFRKRYFHLFDTGVSLFLFHSYTIQ